MNITTIRNNPPLTLPRLQAYIVLAGIKTNSVQKTLEDNKDCWKIEVPAGTLKIFEELVETSSKGWDMANANPSGQLSPIFREAWHFRFDFSGCFSSAGIKTDAWYDYIHGERVLFKTGDIRSEPDIQRVLSYYSKYLNSTQADNLLSEYTNLLREREEIKSALADMYPAEYKKQKDASPYELSFDHEIRHAYSFLLEHYNRTRITNPEPPSLATPAPDGFFTRLSSYLKAFW